MKQSYTDDCFIKIKQKKFIKIKQKKCMKIKQKKLYKNKNIKNKMHPIDYQILLYTANLDQLWDSDHFLQIVY